MAETVYKDFKREEMEYQFNPRVTVTEYPRLTEEREKASEATRAKLKHSRDVRYGDGPQMLLDIFPAEQADAPVHVYIHGGYWRGGSKDAYSFIAEPFVEAGATMVLLEYDLCPQVTVPDIMRETREGIGWVYRHIAEYGGDPQRLYLSGSSAGGHLTARALSHRWEEDGLPVGIIKGAVAITGVYDSEPVFYVSSNEDIRLTPDSAREISAMLHPPLDRTPLVVAVGGAETRGWIGMSRDFFALCQERGVDCSYLEVPGTHHFSVSGQLGERGSLLGRTVLSQMGCLPDDAGNRSDAGAARQE